MATRYWRGGTGNWNNSNTTSWSTSSGGGGGASIPGDGDAVIFDSNSGGGTVTITVQDAQCSTFTGTGSTAVLAHGAFNLQAHGTVVLGSGMSFTGTGLIIMNATGSFTSSGTTIRGLSIYDGTTTLQDAMISAGSVTVGNSIAGATLVLNNFNLSSTTLALGRTDAILTFSGSETVSLSGTGAVFNNNYPSAGGTINAASGTIVFTDTSAANKEFKGGGKTYGTVYFNGSGSGTYYIYGSNTFATIQLNAVTNGLTFEGSTTTTVTTFTASGGSSGSLTTIRSLNPGTFFTLSKSSGTVTCSYMDIQDSHAGGGATWRAPLSTDSGNNTGWIFSAPMLMHALPFA